MLTDFYKSVADVCRRLDINRSQFNKYLSGKSHPSRHVLKTLCDFFGVEEYEMLLPHDEFKKVVELKRSASANLTNYTAYFEQLVRNSRSDVSDYEGYYFEYSYSMAYPGLILRSLMRLQTENGATTYQRMENLARPDQDGRRFRGRYQGMTFYLNDRIFLTDFDSLTRNEISLTILYPNYQSRLKQLTGLKLGVSANSQRAPLCARVVLVALGREIDIRNVLRQCGLYQPDDAQIDPDVKELINNDMQDGGLHFHSALQF